MYIGQADAEFKAMALHGAINPETLDASTRGSGMVVAWCRGRGEVFTAGTCEWVMGLPCSDSLRGDVQVQAITRNVLNRFGEK